tara:strand:- start:1439 stop:2122 length:684 start_codon:yes stop_codon:yes gene_type:complete
MKKYFLLVLIILFSSFNYANTHVEHYNKVSLLKYGLYLNDKLIGTHTFNFKKDGDLFFVNSSGNFKVVKLGVVLMDYKTNTKEVYKEGKLLNFNSKTHQNKKEKFVKVSLNKKKNLDVVGSSFKGVTESNSIVGSWWNHEIIKKGKQISPISGRIIKQKVKFLGKNNISVNEKKYDALHFLFLSDNDKPVNEKKLNINVWYDAKTLLWIKSSYEKLGTWEYRILDVK